MTKVLGIIGGLGPLATAAFYARLVRETDAARDQEHLHVLIDSNPSVPDRTAFLLGVGPDPRPGLIEVGLTLKAMGAELLVVPCNTANVWRAELSEAIGLPIVPWIETAVEAVRMICGSPFGLLATTGTLAVGAYQQAGSDAGMEVLIPEGQEQRDVMQAIYGARGVKTLPGTEEATDLLATAIGRLAARGARGVLLACTELPMALSPTQSYPIPVIDPAVAVARRAIREAQGRVAVERDGGWWFAS